ncbi:hypothetical protein WR25_22436 [Diploscapter pachys]|uniref:Uncharacterized protein n=1 Tax=Diploscapter pachys TaxID=2018661 RepID=A0A2A2LU52_9BILA|nr:hypothetical protein WR25_22436 [Diploscapter pachys]
MLANVGNTIVGTCDLIIQSTTLNSTICELIATGGALFAIAAGIQQSLGGFYGLIGGAFNCPPYEQLWGKC